MVAADLLETIQTWREIYSRISVPEKTRTYSNDTYDQKCLYGMLKVVSGLGVIEEIKNTPVEKHLQKAVEDGKAKDIERLDDIYVLLGEVENYIREKMVN